MASTVANAFGGAGPAALIPQLANAASGNGGLGTYRVSASSASIINALAQFTDVEVVSQPRLLSMNNVPATFFDGTQIPYLGSVQQTAGSAAGSEPTVSGSVAFAIDGVSFSAIPSVVDGNTVQITLIPVLSSVGELKSFLNGALTAPAQSNKQTFMRVLAESNKTLILGGIRYRSDTRHTSLAVSTGSKTGSKEIVILLRANVVAAPDFDPIVSESL
jgi:type II secretory pathway component GspD/PulD (secretin)